MQSKRDDLPKVCIITPSPLTVKSFLIPQLIDLSKYYDVTLITNLSLDNISLEELPVKLIDLPLQRKVSPFADLKAIFLLLQILKKQKFSIVHTIAPKAGLVGMIAAWLSGTPKRIHVFQGEVWVTRTGLWRFILKSIDQLMATLATDLLVVSKSERDFLIEQNIISEKKSRVLREGSICGVNLKRFALDPTIRSNIRTQLNISNEDSVFLFIGRLNKDKGLLELLEAFENLCHAQTSCQLLIVGPDEENIVSLAQKLSPKAQSRIKFINYTSQPEHYMMAADILVLPSHREGFGVVIIEAAAVGITSIGSRIYGISDAILDQKTGLLFKPKDVSDLLQKMQLLLQDKKLRDTLAKNAQSRCQSDFQQKDIVEATTLYYKEKLSELS